MTIRSCKAILFSVDANSELEELILSISIESKVPGTACTGQFLDAMEWNDQGKLVVIGTEDSEALLHRYPELSADNIEIVDFTKQSMTVSLKNLPKLQHLSIHFIVAENGHPEPAVNSALFAVEQDHSRVLEQFYHSTPP